MKPSPQHPYFRPIKTREEFRECFLLLRHALIAGRISLQLAREGLRLKLGELLAASSRETKGTQ